MVANSFYSLTTEERGWVLLEARKNAPGEVGRPTVLPDKIHDGFPLSCPNWDYNTPEGRQCLKVCHQTLMAGLCGAARRPTNLNKVRNVIQGLEESPAAYLEWLMEAYLWFTPYDPNSDEHKATVAVSFIDQSARDIRRKL